MNLRALSANVLYQVLIELKPLEFCVNLAESKLVHPKDRSLLRNLCFGVIRNHASLNAVALQLLGKKPKDAYIGLLLELGLFQIKFLRIPTHAAVFNTVSACKTLKLNSASKLMNALLRRYEREQVAWDSVLDQFKLQTLEHPKWMRKQLQRDWGEAASKTIMSENNGRAPMVLRNNPLSQSTDHYIRQLNAQGIDAQPGPLPESIVLSDRLPQQQLPNWGEGACSVQSLSAQAAVHLLNLQRHERVIDVCAAPGNKSLQILQNCPGIALKAMDMSEKRLVQLSQSLNRFKLSLEVVCGDATDDTQWPDEKYDAILLDAPCTASGSIRRNPDIKWLRSPQDIEHCVSVQQRLLKVAWSQLEPGGRLLYATCSIFKAENESQVQDFLSQAPDAKAIPIKIDSFTSDGVGIQIHPQGPWDGFYYALIQKSLN